MVKNIHSGRKSWLHVVPNICDGAVNRQLIINMGNLGAMDGRKSLFISPRGSELLM